MTIKPTSDAVDVTGADGPLWVRVRNQCLESLFYHDEQAWRARTEALRSILASTRPMTEGESGERCHDCGGFYQTVYRVPDDVWTKIAPDKAALGEHTEHRYGGLLCLPCADRRAREKGIRLYFDASVGDWRTPPEDVAGLVAVGVKPGDIPPSATVVDPLAALTTPAPAVSMDEAIEQIVVGFSDKAILRLDIDEDDPRLSLICDEMRCGTRAILSRLRGEAE